MAKVNYKYSRSEIVAYLMYRGCKYKEVVTQENPRYIGNYKTYFVFEEEQSLLDNLENEFNTNANICVNDYMLILKKVKNIIHNNLSKVK